MKLYKSLLISIATLSLLSFACGLSKGELDDSLLWKIEGKNIKTSYLFGTIHLIDSNKFFMPEKVQKAFSNSQKLILEIDITNQMEMAAMMQYASMEDGQTMDKLLSAEDYHLLDSTLQAQTGMGIAPFNTFKPFIVESLFLNQLIEGEMKSYETTLVEMAAESKKPVDGLESVKDQMTLFDELPYEEQATDLMRYVKGDEDMKNTFKEMVALYVEEDLNGLYDYMDEYFPEQKWMEILLNQRNEKWVPIIENNMTESSLFIAVGAGHLGGEKGVIELLRKAGYKVSAVK